MAKVMLVEDDNNLREIYEARLKAEGYTIVSAKDGEEALVVAKAEKPDLVISDIMMPKISGFEMLDILRNTDGLKEVKVIMLTALGQNDDQLRADKLGADRYLVKSQVTLEDIVKVSHELLQDAPASPAADPAPATPAATLAPTSTPTTPAPATPAPDAVIPVAPTPPVPETPATSTPAPAVPTTPAPTTANDIVTSPAGSTAAPIDQPTPADPVVKDSLPDPVPATPPPAAPDSAATAPTVDVPQSSDAVPAGDTDTASSTDKTAPTTAQEEASVEAKIEDFVAGASSNPAPEAAASSSPTSETPPSVTTDTETAPKPEDTPVSKDTPSAAPTVDTAAQASDDKLMNTAVDNLVSDTEEKEAPVQPAADEPKTETATTDAENEDKATDSEEEVESGSDGVTIAHKKVITPLDSKPKQDIQELLALEEAKQAAAAPPPPPTAIIDTGAPGAGAEAQPLAPPAPEAVPQATDFAASKASPPVVDTNSAASPNGPPDPNSIAL